MKPHARDDLLVHGLDEEAVVYDFASTRAHCLNRMALLVWRLCDGKNSIQRISRTLTAQLGQPVDEQVVWLALDQLSKAGMLREAVEAPQIDLRRRRFLKKMALTAGLSIALPAVWSILAPTPAYAASPVSCIPASGCMGTNSPPGCCNNGGNANSCIGPGLGMCTGTTATCNGITKCR